MKKKTLKMAVAAMVVAAAGYGLFLNQSKDGGMSELALANVEALATDEVPVKLPCAQGGKECNFSVKVVDINGAEVIKTGTIENMKYQAIR